MRSPPAQPSKPTWARIPTLEERAAELARDERLTTGDIRRAFALAVGACFFWLAGGLALMGWAFHTTDRGYGQIAFLGGLIIGYAGMTITLARYYLKGEQSGWW